METQIASKTTRGAPRASNRATRKEPTASKTDQAHSLFTKMHGKKSRKEVLEAFVDQVGLTPSSASTYYQKFLTASEGKGPKRVSGTSGRGRRPDESSKAGICRALFKKLGKKPRAQVLTAFMEDAGLTPAGASTYYQKLKHAA